MKTWAESELLFLVGSPGPQVRELCSAMESILGIPETDSLQPSATPLQVGGQEQAS